MIWIRQFLEAKLGTGFHEGEDRPADKLTAAKQSTLNCLKTIKEFLSKQSGSQEDLFREEREQLIEEMDKIRQQNQALIEALLYSRRSAPQVQTPPILREFINESDAEGVKSEDEKTTNTDNDGHSGAGVASETEMCAPLLLTYPPGPSLEQQENARQLVAVFPDLSLSAAFFALKSNDYDLETTTIRLTEELYFDEIIKEDRHYNQNLSSSTPKEAPSLELQNDPPA